MMHLVIPDSSLELIYSHRCVQWLIITVMCFVLFSNNFTKQLSIYHITHIQFLLDTSFAVSFFVTEDMSEKNVEV